jgi:hypothetical protein
MAATPEPRVDHSRRHVGATGEERPHVEVLDAVFAVEKVQSGTLRERDAQEPFDSYTRPGPGVGKMVTMSFLLGTTTTVICKGCGNSGGTDYWVLLITAVTGALGVVVGALIAAKSQAKIEMGRLKEASRLDSERADKEDERLEKRDARERELAIVRAAGVARVMRQRLDRLARSLEVSSTHGIWMPLEVPIDDPMPLEDRKLVASEVTPDEWSKVDRADFQLDIYLVQREIHFKKVGYVEGDEIPGLTEERFRGLQDRTQEATKEASSALSRVARGLN